MAQNDRRNSTSRVGMTRREVLQKVDELLSTGEAARRIEARRRQFEKAVAKLKRAEALNIEKLRRTVTI